MQEQIQIGSHLAFPEKGRRMPAARSINDGINHSAAFIFVISKTLGKLRERNVF